MTVVTLYYASDRESLKGLSAEVGYLQQESIDSTDCYYSHHTNAQAFRYIYIIHIEVSLELMLLLQ